jgi:hypothetical protein
MPEDRGVTLVPSVPDIGGHCQGQYNNPHRRGFACSAPARQQALYSWARIVGCLASSCIAATLTVLDPILKNEIKTEGTINNSDRTFGPTSIFQ